MTGLENTIFIHTIIGFIFIAFVHTLSKEKTMIQEGGEPLPTSSYVMLIVKHIVWIGVVWLTRGIEFTVPDWAYFLYFIGTYLVATVIDVVLRVIVIYTGVLFGKRKQARKTNSEDGGAD